MISCNQNHVYNNQRRFSLYAFLCLELSFTILYSSGAIAKRNVKNRNDDTV